MVLLLIFPLIVVFWFMIIRPQQQRLRAQQALVRALKVGDEVVTTAGIYATITALDDDVATLEVAPGVQIRSARAAIGRRVEPATPEVAAPEAEAHDDLANEHLDHEPLDHEPLDHEDLDHDVADQDVDDEALGGAA